MTLSDKSRRIQVLILFVIFGPVLFLTVLGLVWHSRSRGGVHHEESTLQAYFNLPLTLTDVEFVRPGTTAYFGV